VGSGSDSQHLTTIKASNFNTCSYRNLTRVLNLTVGLLSGRNEVITIEMLGRVRRILQDKLSRFGGRVVMALEVDAGRTC
jgi:hypothetical protein